MTLFEQFVNLKENTVSSKIKLQKETDFTPFVVDKDNHSNLRPLIRAFLESDRIGVGYTTLDKTKGEIEPKLKKKKLYLVGGAVRDHLKGKTIRGFDLVSDATPDEMRKILSQSEENFKEIKPKSHENEKYNNLPKENGKKTFYASNWDKSDKEIEITVEINGEKFPISTLSKHSKSKNFKIDKAEMANSLEDDAKNRDFTINALYIPLTNPDGENSDLIDPHGGAHHLKRGEVVPIEFQKRLKEDPITGQKMIRMMARFGNLKGFPKKILSSLSKDADFSKISKNDIRKEFLKGLENQDVETKSYMDAYDKSGILKFLFPNLNFSIEDIPDAIQGDRWLSVAYVLKENDPKEVKDLLVAGGWNSQEAKDIAHLVKLNHMKKSPYLSDMEHFDIGLSKNKINKWLDVIKGEDQSNVSSSK